MPKIEYADLTLESFRVLDPTVESLFAKIMRDLAKDCELRPYDDKPRTCTLKFCLTPILDQATGLLDYIQFHTEGKPGVPVYRTRNAQLRSDKGRLQFNRDLPDDINQPPLFPGDNH